jgi:hypothetical protein
VDRSELEQTARKLPRGKAPGPSLIPNEIWTLLAPKISERLSLAISRHFAKGTLPRSLKESTTVVLKKEQKKDYSLPSSYRPIALEDTLAKLLEKLLADKLAQAAEEHNLLPWNQMGARKYRSTLSAISLLAACVQTAWKAKPGCVVSMLSLDLAGAFDNVSHERLLWILRKKCLPEWIVRMVESFLTERRTRITTPGYTTDWIPTQTGIPQGSPLSPILFLFFISELLETFQRVDSDTFAIGFVDDTNLITWGDSAQENCKRLTEAHTKCISWAERHGAVFAPAKYQLIHFTKRTGNETDLNSTIQIAGQPVQLQKSSIRVLGVQIDTRLNWKAHIAHATRKGIACYNALARLVASTWGPSLRRSRLLYTAIVRPALLYGSQVWGVRHDGEPAANTLLDTVRKTQNQCLRRVTGGYKRTPIAALEKETGVLLVDLYIDTTALQRASTTRHHAVETEIESLLNQVWTAIRPPPRRQTRGPRAQRTPSRPNQLRRRAKAREEEMQQLLAHQRDITRES